MNALEIWLVAIGLAMDCFAVSIASGILLKRMEWHPILLMASFFGLFQAMMPLVGWLGTSAFSHLIEKVDHWIAFGILAYLGFNMICESCKEGTCRKEYNPKKLKVICTLAIATSIDALAVGISFACLGYQHLAAILSPVAIIGFVSFALSISGLLIGIVYGNGLARKLKAEMFGGIILIIIGTKILIEHLLFH